MFQQNVATRSPAPTPRPGQRGGEPLGVGRRSRRTWCAAGAVAVPGHALAVAEHRGAVLEDRGDGEREIVLHRARDHRELRSSARPGSAQPRPCRQRRLCPAQRHSVRASASARARSAGVVILNAASRPGDRDDAHAERLDQRGVVGRGRAAPACAPRPARSRRKPCGVCTAARWTGRPVHRALPARCRRLDPAHGVVDRDDRDHRVGAAGQRGQHAVDHLDRHERAGDVVHQHEVDVRGQRRQPGRHRLLPGRPRRPRPGRRATRPRPASTSSAGAHRRSRPDPGMGSRKRSTGVLEQGRAGDLDERLRHARRRAAGRSRRQREWRRRSSDRSPPSKC